MTVVYLLLPGLRPYIHTKTCVCMCVCMHVCVCARVVTYTCSFNTYVYLILNHKL